MEVFRKDDLEVNRNESYCSGSVKPVSPFLTEESSRKDIFFHCHERFITLYTAISSRDAFSAGGRKGHFSRFVINDLSQYPLHAVADH